MATVNPNINYFWGTLVLPRLGSATHVADSYSWGGSFSSIDINQGTDCSGAVSAELSALVRGANMIYVRQFWTGSYAGINPGQTGPFFGCTDTTNLVCIASPTDAPADAAMIIAIIQTGPDSALADQAHMICRVPDYTKPGTDIKTTGIDIEMGGQSNNYHSSQTDSTCASVMDTTEFNQWFYLPSLDPSNSPPQQTQQVGTVATGGQKPVTLYYPDVANVNWTDTETLTTQGQQNLLSFLSQLQGEGFAGVAHKMSQGSGFIDPYGTIAQTWCAQNNFPFIGYHYLSTDDPTAQAQNWLAAGGGTNAMFDWEDGGGDLNNFFAVVNAFNAAGVNVQLGYCPQWYWNGAGDLSSLTSNGILLVSSAYPDGGGAASTIYASSGGDTGEGWTAFGGAKPIAWQFTNQASIAGFTVDCNAYIGTDINVLFGTTPAATPPVVVTPPATPVTTYPYPWALPTDDSIAAAASVVVSQFLGAS